MHRTRQRADGYGKLDETDIVTREQMLLDAIADAYVRGERRGAEREREACAQIALNEPEFPGPAPAWLTSVSPEDLVRSVCRATKKSIAAAIRARGREEKNP